MLVVGVRRIKVIEYQILPSPFMYSGMGWLPIIPPKTLGIVCCNSSSQKVFKLNGRPTWFFFCEIEQTFIETLRTGGATAYTEAIKCSRAHLGPCALNAYPVCALLC